jgi:hypothetical protein
MTTATTWHRIEPRVRGADPEVGLGAAIHDSRWLLGRQWQLGELLGEDCGSPVGIRVENVEHPLSRWRPAFGKPADYARRMCPLEVLYGFEVSVSVV